MLKIEKNDAKCLVVSNNAAILNNLYEIPIRILHI